jgi:hypothetical protein
MAAALCGQRPAGLLPKDLTLGILACPRRLL